MKVCSLASSSKGNCTAIYNDNSIILIDMGISLKSLEEKFERLHLDINKIIGVVVTHEHGDHTKGIGTLVKKYGVPVFCHFNSLAGVLFKAKLQQNSVIRFNDSPFVLGDFIIDPFHVSHDVFCVGFNIYENSTKVSIMTDLGYTTTDIVERLYDSRLVILEANHDEEMVRTGKYPAMLKARVLGDKGHLSNIASARIVESLAQHNVKQVLFAHLSEENNTPDVCYSTICEYLLSCGIEPQVHIKLDIAKPDGIGPIFILK